MNLKMNTPFSDMVMNQSHAYIFRNVYCAIHLLHSMSLSLYCVSCCKLYLQHQLFLFQIKMSFLP